MPEQTFLFEDLHDRLSQRNLVAAGVVVHGVGAEAVLQGACLVQYIQLHSLDEHVGPVLRQAGGIGVAVLVVEQPASEYCAGRKSAESRRS